MAKKPFISVDGITVGEANALVNVILANGDITTSNITIGNNANLGNVGNIIITGGSSGYVLSTNGSGNLSWVAQSGGGGSTSNISNGNSNVNIATENGNITMSAVGNANIVVVTGTGASINGLLSITGNIIPTANITYDLGNNTNRFKDLYLSGNTINLGDSNFSSNATTVTIRNQLGGQFIIGGTGTVNSADLTGYSIANGNSNVSVVSNGNVNISSAGNANIVTVTGTGANITGTLNVTGNATVGNIITGAGSGGNITGANVISANTITASGNITAGNANLGNAVTANYFIGTFYGTANSATTATSATTAGTVTTAAQPNITSVGTLTSLIVSGTGSFGANVNLNSFNITNLATPVASTDAATKQYVDDVAQGLNVHDAVAAATPTTLATITSGTITYNNGSSGVGANLTTTGTFNLIDGVNVQTSGTRILVKNEANAVFNGIYTWSNATVITRATDYNTVPEVEAGDFVFVSGGTLYDNTGWVQTSTVTAIGTAGNNIEFTQFSGAGTYQAGTGLTLTGSTFSVNASQTQITTVGTLGDLTVTGNATVGNLVTSGSGGTLSNINVVSANTFTASGNITAGNANLGNLVTANFFSGNGSLLTGITVSAGNTIVNGNSNVVVLANGNVSTSVAGNANILIVTGTGVNIAGTLNTTGNLTAGNANITGTISVTGNANVGNIGAAAGVFTTVTGSLTTASQPNITSVGTLTSLSVTGNISSGNANLGNLATANFFSGSGNNLSNIQGGNVTGQVGNALVAGTVYTAAQPNITSVGTLTSLSVTGNISSGNANLGNLVIANFFSGSGNNLSNIQGGNVTGQVANALVAGTVYTAAQPNITSVGTLTGLTSNGIINFTNSSNVSLGAVGNVKITGGTNAYVLSTDGAGNLSWVAQSGGGGGGSSISNGNSNVNIPTSNGNINFTAVGNTNMVITGTSVNVAGILNSTSNVTFTGANVSLGAVGNVKITGGSNGYVLTTDGSGNLSWSVSSGPSGSSNIVLDSFTGNGVQTVFELTTTPTSEDYTLINIDGVSQLHSAYTVANANVTLSSPPASGAVIEVMTFNLGGGNSSGGSTYVEVTANTTATANTKYIVNTDSSNITVTLPSSPSLGTEVGIIDGTGNASVHAITVGRNGGNIQGTASDMTVTTNRSAFTLVYYNAAQGWILTNV